MKTKALTILGLFISLIILSQENESILLDEVNVNPPVFQAEKIESDYLTATNNLNQFISENIQYPKSAIKNHQQGIVVVDFLINENGSISNIKVINSISPELDQEVVRLIGLTNNLWRPGNNNGTFIAMDKEIAVQFMIDYSLTDVYKKQSEMYFISGTKKLFLKDNPKAALKMFNMSMKYRPFDTAVLLGRYMCYLKLGLMEEAQSDLKRINDLGGFDSAITAVKNYEKDNEVSFNKILTYLDDEK